MQVLRDVSERPNPAGAAQSSGGEVTHRVFSGEVFVDASTTNARFFVETSCVDLNGQQRR